MQRGNWPISQDVALRNRSDQNPSVSRCETMSPIDSALYSQVWMIEAPLYLEPEKDRRVENFKTGNPFKDDETDRIRPTMNVADFVEREFIPGYVMSKTTAGRAHFQGILKHILLPERTARAFRPGGK